MGLIGGGVNSPFELPLEVDGVKNLAIFGPLGVGKSSLIGQMVCNYLQIPDSRIFWLDVDHSSFVLAHCLNAAYYEPGAEGSPALCPLAMLDTPGGAERCYTWFEDLLSRWNYKLSARAAKEFGFVLRNAIGNERHQPIRRLSEFRGLLQNDGFSDLFEILDRYCGFWRHVFDGLPAATNRNRLTVYEMRRLWSMSEQAAGPATKLILDDIISQLDGKSPAWIFLDEFGLLLQNKILGGEWIDDVIRSLRRKNCGLIVATHDVDDIAMRPDYSLLLINFPARLFLPNPQAAGDIAGAGYRRLKLNETQIQCIASATPKRDALYVSALESRLAAFPLGEISRHIIGATALSDVQQARTVLEHYNGNFLAAWLDERIPGWQYRFPELAEAAHDSRGRVDP